MNERPDQPGSIDQAITAEIRAELGAQKMQRLELANRSGIAVRSLRTYLSDKRTMSIGQTEAIARALGMDLVTLVDRAYKRAEQTPGVHVEAVGDRLDHRGRKSPDGGGGQLEDSSGDRRDADGHGGAPPSGQAPSAASPHAPAAAS